MKSTELAVTTGNRLVTDLTNEIARFCRDHVMPAFISPSVSIPVLNGRLALGTWQSVVLVDPNGDNPHRHVRLSFIAG